MTALEVVERDEHTTRLRVACSSGFYVRSLAHDLGQRLGCGAHLDGSATNEGGRLHDLKRP